LITLTLQLGKSVNHYHLQHTEYHKMTKTKPQIKIVNAETGEEIVRDATPEEIAQKEIDAANAAARKAEAEAKAQAKAAAEGKLAALGLTTDDLRALGL
jgi:hypothetical protein